jgi:hypothetical protein
MVAERRSPPEKGMLNVTVGVPVWALVVTLVGMIYTGGQWNQKMNTLLEGFVKLEAAIVKIQEAQTLAATASAQLQTMATAHEARLTALELLARRK